MPFIVNLPGRKCIQMGFYDNTENHLFPSIILLECCMWRKVKSAIYINKVFCCLKRTDFQKYMNRKLLCWDWQAYRTSWTQTIMIFCESCVKQTFSWVKHYRLQTIFQPVAWYICSPWCFSHSVISQVPLMPVLNTQSRCLVQHLWKTIT